MPIFAHPFRTPKTLRAFTRSSKGGRVSFCTFASADTARDLKKLMPLAKSDPRCMGGVRWRRLNLPPRREIKQLRQLYPEPEPVRNGMGSGFFILP